MSLRGDFQTAVVNMREGEVPSQKPRSVRKLLKIVFYQSLIFLDGGPGGRGGMRAGSTRAI
jgi:hypothetical protein